jgi:hypothetical protein
MTTENNSAVSHVSDAHETLSPATEEKTVPKSTKTRKPSKAENVKGAATQAKEKAKVVPIFTPAQAIGKFAENFDKAKSTKLKDLYDTLQEDFANETNSRIEIGKTLIDARTLLGEDFSKFLGDCVIEMFRRSQSTLYSYIALYQVFSLKFAKNVVVKKALSRIWGAEGCFDTVNGELKEEVSTAIRMCGGIPKSTDSATCEVWARQFVKTVDGLVKKGRSAQPGGRQSAENIIKRSASIVKAYNAFVKSDDKNPVTSKQAIELLTEILVVSIVNLSSSSVTAAFTAATTRVSLNEMKVKNAHEALEASKEVMPDVGDKLAQQKAARDAVRQSA